MSTTIQQLSAEIASGPLAAKLGPLAAAICAALAVNPDLEAVAGKFETSAAHVRQAHDYAMAHLPS